MEEKTKWEKISSNEFEYSGEQLKYHVLGIITTNPTLLNLTLIIESSSTDLNNFKQKVDFLNPEELEESVYEWLEGSGIDYDQCFLELREIKEHLSDEQSFRIQKYASTTSGRNTKVEKEAQKLLESKQLFKGLDDLISKSGVIGEDKNRLALFLLCASYKFDCNFHIVLQSDNVRFGNRLVRNLIRLIPEEDIRDIDMISRKGFRYLGKRALNNKLIPIWDYDDVINVNALGDLKKLQEKGKLTSDSPKRNKEGDLVPNHHKVKDKFSSIGVCRQSKDYFAYQPKTVILGVDKSAEQKERIIKYQSSVRAGLIDKKSERKAQDLLHSVIDKLYPHKVINRFAVDLSIPTYLPNSIELTEQLMQFIELVTLFHQYQRELDNQSRIITTKEDIITAINLFADLLMINMDDLDPRSRELFEKMKKLYLKSPDEKGSVLKSREIKEALKIRGGTATRFLNTLVKRDYVEVEGQKNSGYSYKIIRWSEIDSIKDLLLKQLEELA